MIPVFNEEETLVSVTQEILKQAYVSELIIVNDGSSDLSGEQIDALALLDKRILPITHELNFGKGRALQSAFKIATGEAIFVLDADREYDPKELKVLMEPLLENRADFVVGSRFSFNTKNKCPYFFQFLTNKLLTRIFNIFWGLSLTDILCGHKLFHKKLLPYMSLEQNGFGTDIEMLSKARLANARIVEVPVTYNGRTYAQGKKIHWANAILFVGLLIKYFLPMISRNVKIFDKIASYRTNEYDLDQSGIRIPKASREFQKYRKKLTRPSSFWVFFVILIAGLSATSDGSNSKQTDLLSLQALAKGASEIIRKNQGQQGYWTTDHTPNYVFQMPTPEVNNWLGPLMVDVLSPIAEKANLSTTLQKARHFISANIEQTGLVRYLPLVDPLQNSKRGCKKITPDADDTALAWRLESNIDYRLLNKSLGVLKNYQREGGLYRTWLSPPELYKCLVPGTVPNETDIGINIHIFQFFAKFNSVEANKLCQSILGAVNYDEHWVYNKLSPLIPLLREVELENNNCVLRIPSHRFEGLNYQERIWVNLVHFINTTRRKERYDRDAAINLLSKLSADDFSWIHKFPPLLYHSDLDISSRYYWSESFGLALWLRLYYLILSEKSQ